jgi:DNA-binding protein H-NS
MATIDLSTYNLGELKGLQFDIEQEIRKRERQEIRTARERILAIAQGAGVAVDELLDDASAKKKKASFRSRSR